MNRLFFMLFTKFLLLPLFLISFVYLFYQCYNTIHWLIKSRYNNSQTDYESRKVRTHSQKLLIPSICVLLSVTLTIHYYRPLTYDQMLEYDLNTVTNHLSLEYAKEDRFTVKLDSDQLNQLKATLDTYEYKPLINQSFSGGEEFISLSLYNIRSNNKNGPFIISFWNDGAISVGYNKGADILYSITLDNKSALFNDLKATFVLNNK